MGLFDKMFQSKPESKPVNTESNESSQMDTNKTKMEKLSVQVIQKSQGKKTFEEDITDN